MVKNAEILLPREVEHLSEAEQLLVLPLLQLLLRLGAQHHTVVLILVLMSLLHSLLLILHLILAQPGAFPGLLVVHDSLSCGRYGSFT